MCKMSESITNLAAALIEFNGEVKRIEKDGNNPHFKSKYATLDGVEDEIRPLLQKHGLATMQFPGKDGDDVTVKTLLIHKSGEWLESETTAARPVKSDPQGVGSAITYLRRYSLTAFLSLSTGDVDDDGNAASEQPNQPRQQPTTTTQSSTQGQSGSQQSSSGTDPSKRVYGLMSSMKWSFDDLSRFATEWFNKEIRNLKNQIKTQEEWNSLYNALNHYNETGQMPPKVV